MAGNRNKKGKNARAKEQAQEPTVDRVLWVVPCLLAFALYIPVLRFGFIFDDHTLIETNPQVHSWDYLPRLLSTHLWSHKAEDTLIPQYRPLFSVWLLSVFTVGGLSTWFWHLTSIALHVFATYFVFRLALGVLDNAHAAAGAALLFAVHPIHVEPVSWVSSCNELLYTNFVLSSLFVFCYSLKAAHKPSAKSLMWLSVGLYCAAIFTKESALPVLPLFFYWAFRMTDIPLDWRSRLRQTLRFGAPYLAVVAIYFVARLLAIGRVGLESGQHSWQQVIYSTPSILAFYWKKLVFPVSLSGFYLNPLIAAPTNQMWVTAMLILFCFGILTWLSLKRSPAFGLASVLLVFPIFPVLAGIRVFLVGDLAHDRYMYLPSAGLCLFLGLMAKYVLTRPKTTRVIAGVAGVFVLTCFAGLTLAQESIYRNDEAYFGRGVEVGPSNVLARDYLGDYYLMHGQMDRALEQFKRAHEIDPNDTYATFCLARGLFSDHQYSAAQPYLEQLVSSSQLGPERRAVTLLALGETQIKLKNLTRAEEVLKQLANENDSYYGLHDTMGTLYQMEGRIPEAQKEYAREFQVSGNPVSGQKAFYLARLLAGNQVPASASSQSLPPLGH